MGASSELVRVDKRIAKEIRDYQRKLEKEKDMPVAFTWASGKWYEDFKGVKKIKVQGVKKQQGSFIGFR